MPSFLMIDETMLLALSSGKPGKEVVVMNVSQSDQPGRLQRGGSIVRHH